MLRRLIMAYIVIHKLVTVISLDLTTYERNVKFFVYNNISSESYISTFNNSLSDFDCDPFGKFAFVIHGWTESIKSEWVMDTITNLTFYRGGCVLFMDYSEYARNPNYFGLVTHFHSLAHLLARKIKQVTKNFSNVFMFGFSFGARLCLQAGGLVGYQLIDHIQICDPAGPGFDDESIDPKLAAKYVYCINTSDFYGTTRYNCHINFRMGVCGFRQIGNRPKPCGSHGLCPYFFNSAFNNVFIANDHYNCPSSRKGVNVPADFRMGYMESRRSYLYFGDVFIPTGKNRPWNVVDSNYLKNEI